MNEFTRLLDDPGLRLNRRHFFSRTSLGLGGAALASLLSEPESAGTDAGATPDAREARSPVAIDPAGGASSGVSRPAQGQAGHLPVHERRAVAARPVRLQAAPERDERPGPARVGPDGAAAHGDVGQPGDAADGRLDLQVRPARQVGRVGQRAPAAHRAGRRRALHHQLALHRGDQPRPGDHLLPDRLDDRRPAVDGGLAELRPGLGQPEPADVLRADQPEAARPAAVFPALGQRVPAVGPPGGAVPRGGRSGALPREPAGRLGRRPPQDARPAPRAAPDRVRRDARPGDPGPDRPVRDGLPDADLRARGDAGRRTSPSTSSTSTARTRGSRGPSPPTACWPAGWPSATSGSSSSITPAGTITAACPAASASSAARPTRPARR